jgi:O-antigen ligase
MEIFSLQMIRRFSIVSLYIIIITLIDDEKKLDRILKILLVAYFFVGLTGLYELFSGKSILQARFGNLPRFTLHALLDEGLRISGPSGDPDFHAVAMVFPTILSCMFLYLSQSKKMKLLMLGLFCFFLLNVNGTNSRGGLIAVFIGLFTMWWFLKLRWKYFIAVAFIVLFSGVIFLYLTVIPGSSMKRYTGELGMKSIQYRIGYIDMTLSIIKKHPILGIGTGNFITEYNRYNNKKVPPNPLWPLNSILQAWAENGFFGMVAYLLGFFWALRNAYRVVKFEKDENLRSTSLAVLGTILGLLFFASVSNVLENQDYWIIFSFSVVLLNCHLAKRHGRLVSPDYSSKP